MCICIYILLNYILYSSPAPLKIKNNKVVRYNFVLKKWIFILRNKKGFGHYFDVMKNNLLHPERYSVL